MATSLAALLVRNTKAQLYAKALEVATAVGLPVTSWAAGDPTRSDYHYLSEILEVLEGIAVEYIAAGFLDFAVERAIATGDSTWLKILAKQLYGVDVTEATFAQTACTLTNGGGALYVIEPGDLTAKSTDDKTYHNITGGMLASGPGSTLSLTFEADEPGSDSNAGANEINELVTKLLEVTITNPTAATAVDEEAPPDVAVRCRAKLGALSPNGPRDAYNYVATTPALSGTTNVTRSRSVGDSDTGDVYQYLAGPSGAVTSDDVDAVEAAVLEHAVPLTITPNVRNSTNVVISPTYQLWLYSSIGLETDEIEEAVADALAAMFRRRPIGGDVIAPATGRIYHSMIESTIRNVYKDHAFRVALTVPAGDTDLDLDTTIGEVAVLGAITATITFVEPP